MTISAPSDVRVGVALSGGGHRAACWSTGALLALVDVGVHADVVSIASVSGGSIANGAVVAAGDLRTVHSATFETWTRQPLRQWAHDGLFFSGPRTDGWLWGTLFMMFVGISAVLAACSAAIATGRGELSATSMLVAASVVVVVALLTALPAVRAMPTARLKASVIVGTLMAWPITFAALALVSLNAWWIVAVVALTAILLWLAIRRFGHRSSTVEHALEASFGSRDSALTLAQRSDPDTWPVHHIFCAADLNTGNNLYFTNRLVWGYPGIAAQPNAVTVARAVQSSACLPGAFLARHFDTLPTSPVTDVPVALSDGGVYDNMADQWEWGYPNRLEQAGSQLTQAQPEPANLLVVVNASRGMYGRTDTPTKPGIRGELKSALGAKDVIYDVSTTTRRRLLIDHFDRAAATGEGLGGMLVHIGSTPYTIIDRYAADTDARGTHARAAQATLDAITDTDTDSPQSAQQRRQHWLDIAKRNSGVKTTLAALETLQPGSTASLLQHAYVLTRINGWILHGWQPGNAGQTQPWQLTRFEQLVEASRIA